MEPKSVPLTPELYDYVVEMRSRRDDPVLRDLRAETEQLGDISQMLISEDQGSFFTLLVSALGVRNALEIGTFTGYSATCIARGLQPGGKLICCDRSDEWTSVARRYWERDGVHDKIELRLGDGHETVRQLTGERFDFVFIDADKTGYDDYYEVVLPLVKANGLIVFDNMLWEGRVVQQPLEDEAGLAIDALNRKLSRDPRVESMLVPLADGLHICRKLA